MKVNKTTTAQDVKRLHKLKTLDDFEIADQDPDITGWEVFSSDDVKFGKIEDLIIDKEQMKAEYADMVVDKHYITGKTENHLLIPMEMIHVDKDHKKVYVTKIVSKDLEIFPYYNGVDITSHYEKTLREKLIESGESKRTGFTD
ncbi:MAG: PRC-barrel domain-containing protein [Bacteroidota bacterium]|nr:PRC-barrel domain-containing protein [Bacteroidota bacterium]